MTDTAKSKPNDVARAVAGTRLAAGASAVGAVLWIAVIVMQIAAGLWPFVAWNILAGAATVASIVAILRRVPGAYSPAVVLFYYNALWSAFWALRAKPLSFLWIACAASAVAALALSASRRAFPGLEPAPKAPEKEDNFGFWLKENVEAVVVAFIMALVIRCFCIEVFKIPSSSMEPTLMGDKSDSQGDRIMVTKYYYALNPVERFDVVVFKFPLNQVRNFIKRVVGLPGEDFFVDRGNIWTLSKDDPTYALAKDNPKRKYRIARKPMRIQQAIWIRREDEGAMTGDVLADRARFNHYWRPEDDSDEPKKYEVERGALRTVEHKRRADDKHSKDIRFIYQHPIKVGSDDVADCTISFDLELKDKTGVFFVDIPNEFGRFKLELSADTAGRMVWNGPKERSLEVPVKPVRLAPERIYHVEFMVYDGAAYAIIDGETTELPFSEYYDELETEPAKIDRLQFGANGALFAVANFQSGRDIHHEERYPNTLRGPANAIEIPEDHFVMMGDNVGSSHDSRAWKEEIFYISDDAAARLGVKTTDEMRKEYGGPVLRCESQDVTNNADACERYAKQHGLKETPNRQLQADDIGYERFFYERELRDKKHEERRFPFVHRKYLVGKALWVWFPMGRWFRLIR